MCSCRESACVPVDNAAPRHRTRQARERNNHQPNTRTCYTPMHACILVFFKYDVYLFFIRLLYGLNSNLREGLLIIFAFVYVCVECSPQHLLDERCRAFLLFYVLTMQESPIPSLFHSCLHIHFGTLESFWTSCKQPFSFSPLYIVAPLLLVFFSLLSTCIPTASPSPTNVSGFVSASSVVAPHPPEVRGGGCAQRYCCKRQAALRMCLVLAAIGIRT